MEKVRSTTLAPRPDALAIPLDPERRIKPIEELDDLIDVFADVREEPDDPMEVERSSTAFRGCAINDQTISPRHRATAQALLDRLAKLFRGPFIGSGVLADLCGVARAWLCGDVVLPVQKGPQQFDKTLHVYQYDNSRQTVNCFLYHLPTARTFLSHRALALARTARGMAAPLLAAPTHACGWIDAAAPSVRSFGIPESRSRPA